VQVIERQAYDKSGALIHPRLLERYQRKATITASYAGQEEQFAAQLHAHFNLVLEAIAAGRSELISTSICSMSWSATSIWRN
jgi:CPA1 family monovalent cation:H+ antiporter